MTDKIDTESFKQLERLRELGRKVQLCLVDMNMPQMNGLEFVDAVVAQPSLKRLRLVFVTTEDEAVGRDAIVAGACAYIRKPLTWTRLMEVLPRRSLFRKPDFPMADYWWWYRSFEEVGDDQLLDLLNE